MATYTLCEDCTEHPFTTFPVPLLWIRVQVGRALPEHSAGELRDLCKLLESDIEPHKPGTRWIGTVCVMSPSFSGGLMVGSECSILNMVMCGGWIGTPSHLAFGGANSWVKKFKKHGHVFSVNWYNVHHLTSCWGQWLGEEA